MPVARTDDSVSIAYRAQGTGPRTLIFLHGWGGSRSYFNETIESLDLTAVRAITLDLRGHGDSDKPDTELTLERVARDVFAVGDDAAADAFVAVGFSMGGKLAQYLPLVDPSRVKGLVLVASPTAGELPTPDFVAEWVGLAGDAQAFVDAIVPYLHRTVPEHVLQRYGEDWAKIPPAYLERTLNLVASTSFIERLASVLVHTLVVAGGRDPLHSEMRDAVIASLPNAHLEILDCGAEIPLEAPAELARLIQKFVAELL